MRPIVFCCSAARSAYRAGDLIFSLRAKGWIVESAPLRSMSHRARWLGGEREIHDHTGEYYTWQSCPFCGEELPFGELPREMRTTDGEESD